MNLELTSEEAEEVRYLISQGAGREDHPRGAMLWALHDRIEEILDVPVCDHCGEPVKGDECPRDEEWIHETDLYGCSEDKVATVNGNYKVPTDLPGFEGTTDALNRLTIKKSGVVTVTTHDELVNALEGDEKVIELRGKYFGWVDVRRDVTFVARDTSTVTLNASDKSDVYLYAYGTSTVTLDASDTSTVNLNAYGSSTVTLDASDTSTVNLNAYDSSTVNLNAYGSSTVTLNASDSSTVTKNFIGKCATVNEWDGKKYVTIKGE